MLDRLCIFPAEKIRFQTENVTHGVGAIFRGKEKNLHGMSAQV
jgi:hypothetical protein